MKDREDAFTLLSHVIIFCDENAGQTNMYTPQGIIALTLT